MAKHWISSFSIGTTSYLSLARRHGDMRKRHSPQGGTPGQNSKVLRFLEDFLGTITLIRWFDESSNTSGSLRIEGVYKCTSLKTSRTSSQKLGHCSKVHFSKFHATEKRVARHLIPLKVHPPKRLLSQIFRDLSNNTHTEVVTPSALRAHH